MEKPLREWTEADLMALVRSGRIEGPMLEYKAALYDSTDRGNREFLLDICSMANSNGGTLLIGVAEQRDANGPTGAPELEFGGQTGLVLRG
jgi:predicted HTH transcriptional regulator